MTNLTPNEQIVLKAVIAFFNYGDETEKDDNAVMFNLKELKAETGISLQALKGITGSLFKKNLLCRMEGGETGTTSRWVSRMKASMLYLS